MIHNRRTGMEPPTLLVTHTSDRRIKAVFALTLLVFGGIAISAYLGIRSYLFNTRSVAASTHLHMELDDLASALKDVQRGARGYVITQDTAFLPPYRDGLTKVRDRLAALRDGVDSASGQPMELETVRALIDRLLAVTGQEVGFIQGGSPDLARETVRKGEAKRSMDRIDAIVTVMMQKEANRIAERLAEAESDFNGSITILILGTILNFALVTGMFVLTRRQMRDRREAAEKLRMEDQRLLTVVNSIQEGITFSHPGGGFEVFNKRMTEITGYTLEEANRAGDFSRLIYPDPADRQKALDGVKRVMEEPGVHASESEITTRSGASRVLRVSSQMIGLSGRRMFLTTYADVTEQKRIEREREGLILELQKALAEVKTLGGLLPICAWCKKIRDDQGYYHQIETYIANHSEVKFTHGICPGCREKFDREADAVLREHEEYPD